MTVLGPWCGPCVRCLEHFFLSTPTVALPGLRPQGKRTIGRLSSVISWRERSALEQAAEDVAAVLDPLEHVGIAQVLEGTGLLGALLDLLPQPRSRDVRRGATPQRVGADRGLGPGVLRPVEEHLPGAFRLCHLGGDEPWVLLLQLLGDLLRCLTH